VLAREEADGRLTILAGDRRVVAARDTGQLLPVRILGGERLDQLCKAFNEDSCRTTRSIVERGALAREIIEEAREQGIEPTRRWLADALGVSLGTAHNLAAVGEHLSPKRVDILAEETGIDPDVIRRLPVRKALRVAAEEDNVAAATVLKELTTDARKPVAQPTPMSAWRRLLLRILRFFVSAWSSITQA
jgi:hypothetical protein